MANFNYMYTLKQHGISNASQNGRIIFLEAETRISSTKKKRFVQEKKCSCSSSSIDRNCLNTTSGRADTIRYIQDSARHATQSASITYYLSQNGSDQHHQGPILQIRSHVTQKSPYETVECMLQHVTKIQETMEGILMLLRARLFKYITD